MQAFRERGRPEKVVQAIQITEAMLRGEEALPPHTAIEAEWRREVICPGGAGFPGSWIVYADGGMDVLTPEAFGARYEPAAEAAP